LQEWGGDPDALPDADLAALTEEGEAALVRRIAQFPEVIETAAEDYAPHQVAFYLKDLAAEFHAWYHHNRILSRPDKPLLPEIQQARLALAAAAREVIYNGLTLLGVSCPEHM